MCNFGRKIAAINSWGISLSIVDITGEDNRSASSFQQAGVPQPAFVQLGVPSGLSAQSTAQNVTPVQFGSLPGFSTQSAFQTATPARQFPLNTTTQSTEPPVFGQHHTPSIPVQNVGHPTNVQPFPPVPSRGGQNVERNPQHRTPAPVGSFTRQPLVSIPVPGLFQRASTQPSSFQALSAQSGPRSAVTQALKATTSGYPSRVNHPAATVTRQPFSPRPGFGAPASRQPLASMISPGLFQQSRPSSEPVAPGGLRQFTNVVPVVAGTTTQPRRTNSAPCASTTAVAQTATRTAATTETPIAAPIDAPTLAPTAAPTLEPTAAPTTTAVPTATAAVTPTAALSAGAPVQTAQQPVEANMPFTPEDLNLQQEMTPVHQQTPPSNMLAWRSKGKSALLGFSLNGTDFTEFGEFRESTEA